MDVARERAIGEQQPQDINLYNLYTMTELKVGLGGKIKLHNAGKMSSNTSKAFHW